MDSKNVLFAVVLSALVLVIWGIFFEPPPTKNQTTQNEIKQNNESSSPSIEVEENKNKVKRITAINNDDRIKIENANIKGSISLKGAIIDDIIFKNYKKNLESEDKVIFLYPKDSPREYFIETVWSSDGDE